jgi:hypothetical protein
VIPGFAFQKFANFTFEEAQILPQLDVRKPLSNAFAGVLVNPTFGNLEQRSNLFNGEELIELL